MGHLGAVGDASPPARRRVLEETALPLVAGLGVKLGRQATPGRPALLWLAASPPVPTPGWRLGLQGACSRVTEASASPAMVLRVPQTAFGVPRQLFQKTVSHAAETHSFLPGVGATPTVPQGWALRPPCALSA